MAIETSRNNRSVKILKISKRGSHKLSKRKAGEPTWSASGFSNGQAPSCMPMPNGVEER